MDLTQPPDEAPDDATHVVEVRPLPPSRVRRARRRERSVRGTLWRVELAAWAVAFSALVATALTPYRLVPRLEVSWAHENTWPRVLIASLLALLLVRLVRVGPRWPTLVIPSSVVIALIAIVLGSATYLRCMPQEVPLVSVAGWVLELFVGGVEMDSAGRQCIGAGAQAFPPAFAMARTFGLLATFVGAVGVGVIAARGPLDRLRATRSRDVDVVVGLDAVTMPLVMALVRENAARPKREGWIQVTRPRADPAPESKWRVRERRPVPEPPSGPAVDQRTPFEVVRERLTGGRPGDRPLWLVRRPHVVVIEPDSSNAYVAAARDLGVIVLIGDPTDAEVLRRVLTRRMSVSFQLRSRAPRSAPGPGRSGGVAAGAAGARAASRRPMRRWRLVRGWSMRRVSLRRMYVVTGSPERDLQVTAAARSCFRPEYAPHRDGVVPRILVRFDHSWQAWGYRNSVLSQQSWVVEEAEASRAAGGEEAEVSHASAGKATTAPAPSYHAVPSGPSALPIVDGITAHDVVCQQVAELFIDPASDRHWNVDRVIVVGDSPMWYSLLNEVQWQLWTRAEILMERRTRLYDRQENLTALEQRARELRDPASGAGAADLRADCWLEPGGEDANPPRLAGGR